MVKVKPKTPELAEEYFPERDAMASHIRKLNDLISAQRRDAELRRHLATNTTSNDSYGGFYHTPRKERSERQYFDPWYRSSGEYGKYVAPLPTRELPAEVQIALKKKKAKEQKLEHEERERREKRVYPLPEFAKPLKIPPIAHASGSLSDRTEKAKRQPWPETNAVRQELRTGPVKSFMTHSMARLWNNMDSIPLSKHGGSLTSLIPDTGAKRPVASRLLKGLERKRGNTAYSHSIPSSRSSSPN